MVAGLPLPEGDISGARLAAALRSLDADAKAVVTVAHNEAYRYPTGFLSSAHLLLGLLAVDTAPLAASELDEPHLLDSIRRRLDLYLGPVRHPAQAVHLAYTPHARAILIDAAEHAALESGMTTPKDLWLALQEASGSLAARCLTEINLPITSGSSP